MAETLPIPTVNTLNFPYYWQGSTFACTIFHWGDCIVRDLHHKKKFILINDLHSLLTDCNIRVAIKTLTTAVTTNAFNIKRRPKQSVIADFVKSLRSNTLIPTVLYTINLLRDNAAFAYTVKNGNVVSTPTETYASITIGYALLDVTFQHSLRQCVYCTRTFQRSLLSTEYEGHLRHIKSKISADISDDYFRNILKSVECLTLLKNACKAVAHCCLRPIGSEDIDAVIKNLHYAKIILLDSIEKILEDRESDFFKIVRDNIRCGTYTGTLMHEMRYRQLQTVANNTAQV
jgi:hypothetical protein